MTKSTEESPIEKNLATAPSVFHFLAWLRISSLNLEEWRYISYAEQLYGFTRGTKLTVIDRFPHQMHWIPDRFQLIWDSLDPEESARLGKVKSYLIIVPWMPEGD